MFKDFITCYYRINEIYTFKKYTFKRAFLYLTFLTLIFGSIQAYTKINRINKNFNESINIISTWDFTIENGRFLIKDAPKEITIDNVTIYFPGEGESSVPLTTEDYILVNNGYMEIHLDGITQNIPIINLGNSNKSDFLTSLKFLNILLIVFTYILTVILFFLGKVISAYFIATLSTNSLTARILNYKFSDFFKMSFYVMTPVITIQTILYAIGFDMFLTYFASVTFTIIVSFMFKLILQYEFGIKHNS